MTPLERLTSGLGLTRGDVTVALFLSVTALSGFFYTRFFESEPDFRRRIGMARLLAAADSISTRASLAGLERLTDSTTPPHDPISRDEAIEEGTDGEAPVELSLEDVAPIDVNSAPPEILQLLPGVGEKTALKIVAARPFSGVDDLMRVHGIGPRKLAKMRVYIVAGGSGEVDRAPAETSKSSATSDDSASRAVPDEGGSTSRSSVDVDADSLATGSDSTDDRGDSLRSRGTRR